MNSEGKATSTHSAPRQAQPGVVRIDAHHHLWAYQPEKFGWIDDAMAILRRDFTGRELLREMDAAGVHTAVAVQARQSLEETHWLLEQSTAHPRIVGVVGWAPIAGDRFSEVLGQLKEDTRMVGLRHIVQAEAPGFLDQPEFNRGIAQLEPAGLSYDLLIVERQMEEAIRFVDRHPYQRFAIDHCAKPRIAEGSMEPWASNLRGLAQRPNVVCKVSGLVTEAGPQRWTLDQLRPYLDTVFEAFGPERLMAGSDWPVCLVAASYLNWWEALQRYTETLGVSECRAFYGDTARSFYRLSLDLSLYPEAA